jgi:hypothetical protein
MSKGHMWSSASASTGSGTGSELSMTCPPYGRRPFWFLCPKNGPVDRCAESVRATHFDDPLQRLAGYAYDEGMDASSAGRFESSEAAKSAVLQTGNPDHIWPLK